MVRHGGLYARWWRTALADKEEQLLRNVLYKTVLYRAFLVYKWLTSSSLSTIEVSVLMMLRVTLYKCDFERRCGYRGKTCEISDPKLADTVVVANGLVRARSGIWLGVRRKGSQGSSGTILS